MDSVEVVVDRMSVPTCRAPPSTSPTPSRSRASPSTTPTPPEAAPAASPSTDPLPRRPLPHSRSSCAPHIPDPDRPGCGRLPRAGPAARGRPKNTSATPSAQASPTLTPSIINCAQEAGTIETDSEALPAIGGDAGAEPTVTWSEGKQAPANLVSKTLTSAEGPAVSSGDIITVNYVGWKWGSTEAFDSSFKKGAPITFGLTGVIPGWTCGLAGHKVGERVQLSIPGQARIRRDRRSGSPELADRAARLRRRHHRSYHGR